MAVACALVDVGLANDVCATETAEAEAAKVRGQLGSGRDETAMKGLNLANYRFPAEAHAVSRHVKSAKDAVRYCTLYCAERGLGCALTCKLRKHFKIPPFGDKWPSGENTK